MGFIAPGRRTRVGSWNKNAPSGTVGLVVTLSFAAMIAFQYLVLKG